MITNKFDHIIYTFYSFIEIIDYKQNYQLKATHSDKLLLFSKQNSNKQILYLQQKIFNLSVLKIN